MQVARNIAKRAVRFFYPKPWRSDVMEFRYGLWRGVSPLYAENGRQLGEANTRPFIFQDAVPAETVACKYEGSRYGKRINMSALRTAMMHFRDALAITSTVADNCYLPGKSPPTLGIWDLYILSRASIAVIAFEHRSAGRGQQTPLVPNAFASQYQFITGIFMICRHMMESAAPVITRNRSISADDLYAYADENEIFESFNGMVCAGSKTKILEFLTYCCQGAPFDAAAVQDQYNDINTMVRDPSAWRLYTPHTIEFDCFLEIEYLQRKSHDNPAGRANTEAIIEIYRSLSNYCIKTFGMCVPPEGLSFPDAALARQNAVQALLKRPPLKRIPPRLLTERMNY